eukprot:PhM_4_TR10379/c0_g1_i1/m.84004/K09486/HYOU1; hypoxia up-regulated 1
MQKRSPSVYLACALLVVFIVSMTSEAQGAVIGIDIGSEFLKVAAVRGKAGIDIVLNEQTRRKSHNYVGFRGDERYLGEDAKNFAPRFPNNMITMMNRLVGVSYDDNTTREWYSKEMLLTYDLLRNERRNTIDVRIPKNPEVTYDLETLMGMIFGYAKQMTTNHNEGYVISDAVVVVPSFFDMRQRQALVDAGKLGGVNVIGMIHSTTAVALQYAVQNRGFQNRTVNIVVYDMGTSRTEVGVYTISPPEKGARKADSMGTLTTRYIASDAFLGARSFDACIARKLAGQFKAKSGIDVLAMKTEHNKKATVVLLRSANKLREVLSANKHTPVSVEGIAEDTDFSTVVKREEFEEWCSPLFDRAAKLAKEAIEGAGLTPADLHAFEIHGGGTRMPRLQTDLAEYLGRGVDRTLNGDESAALGATFYAARVSGTFVVRGFAVQEAYPRNVSFVFSAKPDADVAAPLPAHRPLFSKATVPSRKSISVNRTTDFNITFGIVGSDIDSVVKVFNVSEALTSLGFDKPEKHENNTHSIRVEVRLTENGFINVTNVQVKYHEHVNVTKRVKIPVNKSAAVDSNNATAETTNTTSEADESTANNNSTEANQTTAETPKPEDDAPKYKNVYSIELKRRVANVPYEVAYTDPQPMSRSEFKAARQIIKTISAREDEKRATAAAKNDLEGLIIAINTDYLDQYKPDFVNDTEEESIKAVALAVREWLEDGDGAMDDTTKEAFLNKTAEIHEAMSSVTERKRAHEEEIENAKKEAAKKALEEEKAKKDNKKKKDSKKSSSSKKKKTAAKNAKKEDEEEPAAEESADSNENGNDQNKQGDSEEQQQQQQEEDAEGSSNEAKDEKKAEEAEL